MFVNVRGNNIHPNSGDVIRCIGYRQREGADYYIMGDTYTVRKSEYGDHPVVPIRIKGGVVEINAAGTSGIWEKVGTTPDEPIEAWL